MADMMPAPDAGLPVPDADPTSGEAGQPPGKQSYPPPTPVPTQAGLHGIRFDFNQGCRVAVPPGPGGAQVWRVRLRDLNTGNTLFDTILAQGLVNSSKRWFVRFGVDAWRVGEDAPAFTHEYDARTATC